jgi:predicted acyl esterase
MATAQWRRRQLGRRLLHVVRVTTFTSPPMDTDREFTGPGVLTLYASTDQTDIDVFVRVSLVSAALDAGTAAAGRDLPTTGGTPADVLPRSPGATGSDRRSPTRTP